MKYNLEKIVRRRCNFCGREQDVIITDKGYDESCYGCKRIFYVPSREEILECLEEEEDQEQ